jgi:hypothetical protein
MSWLKKRLLRKKVQADAETLAQAVEELKKMADILATQVPSLEEKVKHLDNKVLDSLTKLRAKELSLEQTTKADEDYKSQNTQLTKKPESKYSPLVSFESYVLI